MDSSSLFNSLDGFPTLLISDGIIKKVNGKFVEMTEYEEKELLSSNIEEVFQTLKIGPNFNIVNIDNNRDYFIFTKSYEVRIVKIEVMGEKEKIFIFFMEDNKNIRVRFDFGNMLFSDNYYGIGVYSTPDLTLVKANERYANTFDSPFNKKENCIGRNIEDFLQGFKGSSYEKLWEDVLKSRKPVYIEEFMYD